MAHIPSFPRIADRAPESKIRCDIFCRDVEMRAYLFQALQVICGARWQQDEHAEGPLGVPHLKDLRLQLLDEADSKQTLLIHHLHSLLFILWWTR